MSSNDVIRSVDAGPAKVSRDYELVLGLALEPSYISEIARKIMKMEGEYEDANETQMVRKVAQIAYDLYKQDRIKKTRPSYDDIGGQKEGSPKASFTGSGGGDEEDVGNVGVSETSEWQEYTIIHDPDVDRENVPDKILNSIRPGVGVEDKVNLIDTLSGVGNQVSIDAEEIMQDTMERQFRYYDVTEQPAYNDPGVDFYVEDSDQRDYGLCIEVSTRWVNPIGMPYLNSKKDKALDRDSDLVILAPRFTRELMMEKENPDNPRWHRDPEGEIVHLHRVPNKGPELYRPFAQSPYEDEFEYEGGNPIIVPDEGWVREKLRRDGRVGERYPVVDDNKDEFKDALKAVHRNARIVPESVYRNQLREAIEPMLPNFLKPYKVEQFLIDFYWDRSMDQTDVGRLVDKSGRQISEWMGDEKWDMMTRGTGAPELNPSTIEIWRRMYEGLHPFTDENGDPIEHSMYRIQAEYNRHPYWGLGEWEEWYQDTTEDERREIMTQGDSWRENISYTVMLGPEQRLTPSYTFIRDVLDRNGVDIRPPDQAVRAPYRAYANRETLRHMLNSSVGVVVEDEDGPQKVGQNEVHVFDSYLEVDIATWLSENEIPYAHEPFAVPGEFGPSRTEWDNMAKTVRQAGRGESVEYNGYTSTDILRMWTRIYDKHRLQENDVFIPVNQSLTRFQKNYVVPDLVTYPKNFRDELEVGDIQWDEWEKIVEVAGVWGVGIPEDATEDRWWQWYRVANVAFKELAYKLLGLWGDVYFAIPNSDNVTGPNDDVDVSLREDDHYIIFDSTATELNLGELAVNMSATRDVIDTGLSPAIKPTKYMRDREGSDFVGVEEYKFESIDTDAVGDNSNVYQVGTHWIVWAGYMGNVYITDGSVHVRESQWRDENMVILREYVLDGLRELSEDGIISGLETEV